MSPSVKTSRATGRRRIAKKPVASSDEPVMADLIDALDRASARLVSVPAGPAVWNDHDRTMTRLTNRAGVRARLHIHTSPVAEANGCRWHGNKTAQAAFGSLDGRRPQLLDVVGWTEGATAYRAELVEVVDEPLCSPFAAIDRNLDLPEEWWSGLREALGTVSRIRTQRTTVHQDRVDALVPRHLGVSAPLLRAMVPAHGTLHWANVTSVGPYVLSWENWGRAPVGYDAALLHAFSLRVPDLAERVRAEFPILDTPDGRIAEMVVTAELLDAVVRGEHAELAEPLAAQASRLAAPAVRKLRVRVPVPRSAPVQVAAS